MFYFGLTMLILTRRVGETVVVGDNILVTVLGFKGNQVRLGIEAPSDVSVHREEIFNRLQLDEENEGHEDNIDTFGLFDSKTDHK